MNESALTRTDVVLAAVVSIAGVVLLLFPLLIAPVALPSLQARAVEVPVLTRLFLGALTPPVMAVLCVSLLPLAFLWSKRRRVVLAVAAVVGPALVAIGLLALFVLPA